MEGQSNDELSVEVIRAQVLDQNALVDACRNGNTEKARLLIEYNAEINQKNKAGLSPLHGATLSGDVECVELLLKHKADVDVRDTVKNMTPLMNAAAIGSDVISTILILSEIARLDESKTMSKGSNAYNKLAHSYVRMKDSRGRTALHYAADLGHDSCVDLLLQYGADIDARDNEEKTPLHLCAQAGHDTIVDILIDEGADIDAEDTNSNTPLHLSCIGGSVACLDLLATHGSDVEAKDVDGLTPLHLACLNAKDSVVDSLLTGGDSWESVKDVNAPDELGRTPFHAAAVSGSILCCELLRRNGGDLKLLDDEEKSIITWAVSQRVTHQGDGLVLQCLQDLWKRWEEEEGEEKTASQVDVEGRNALHHACYNGLERCVKFLVGKKIDPKQTDNEGRTALHYAASSPQCVEFLLKFGADVSARDHQGALPLHLAAYFGNKLSVEAVLHALAEHESKPEGTVMAHVDDHGRSVLHYVAFHHQNTNINEIQKVVEFCSSKNRSVMDAQDHTYGRTAIHWAALLGNVAFLQAISLNVSKIELLYYFNTKDQKGRTAAHLAAIYGRIEVFQLLIQHGVDPNQPDSAQWTSLHFAVARNHHQFVKKIVETQSHSNSSQLSEDIIELLDMTRGDAHGRSPLLFACYFGFLESIDVFLFHLPSWYSLVDHDGNSALYYAVEADQAAAVRVLLEDLEDREDDDLTPSPDDYIVLGNHAGLNALHVSSTKGNTSCLEVLLEFSSNVNHTDKSGRSPLHYACMHGHISCLSLLLDERHNADINLADHQGNTPFFYAALGGYLPCVSLLIKHKAKLPVSNAKGRTALHAAAWNGNLRVCETILEAVPTLISKGCENGRTALHRAAARGHLRLIDYLAGIHKDVDSRDSNGTTPLMLACFYQQVDAVKSLLQLNASPLAKDELDRTVQQYATKGAADTVAAPLSEILSLLKAAA